MARTRNPFTPTFGIVPPFLAGRDKLLNEMADAFEDGIGNPNLSSLLIGARGTGKTALLSRIAEEAQECGWIAVNVAATAGMLEDIIQQAGKAASHIVEERSGRRVSGVTVGQILGIEWAFDATEQANWRSRMDALFEKLEEHNVGLLITVDEVRVEIDEIVQLVSTYQLFIREGKKTALVMAGLPMHVTDLINDERITFLRRARQHHLGRISNAEIERAFRKTVECGGKSIEKQALGAAVQASEGFAYMMQLVGYCMWAESEGADAITHQHALHGIKQAQSEFAHGVLESTYREMSQGDRAFARAMLPDNDGSCLADVAKRMGKGSNYASTYKSRLLKLGVIGERGGSTFDFDIPFFREYLSAKDMEPVR